MTFSTIRLAARDELTRRVGQGQASGFPRRDASIMSCGAFSRSATELNPLGCALVPDFWGWAGGEGREGNAKVEVDSCRAGIGKTREGKGKQSTCTNAKSQPPTLRSPAHRKRRNTNYIGCLELCLFLLLFPSMLLASLIFALLVAMSLVWVCILASAFVGGRRARP